MFCSTGCKFAGDGVCDDGGVGAHYSSCLFGTDCGDCGVRGAQPLLPLAMPRLTEPCTKTTTAYACFTYTFATLVIWNFGVYVALMGLCMVAHLCFSFYGLVTAAKLSWVSFFLLFLGLCISLAHESSQGVQLLLLVLLFLPFNLSLCWCVIMADEVTHTLPRVDRSQSIQQQIDFFTLVLGAPAALAAAGAPRVRQRQLYERQEQERVQNQERRRGAEEKALAEGVGAQSQGQALPRVAHRYEAPPSSSRACALVRALSHVPMAAARAIARVLSRGRMEEQQDDTETAVGPVAVQLRQLQYQL